MASRKLTEDQKTKLLSQLSKSLSRRGYKDSTKRVYIYHVGTFLNNVGTSNVSPKVIKKEFSQATSKKSRAYKMQWAAGVKHLYEVLKNKELSQAASDLVAGHPQA